MGRKTWLSPERAAVLGQRVLLFVRRQYNLRRAGQGNLDRGGLRSYHVEGSTRSSNPDPPTRHGTHRPNRRKRQFRRVGGA